MSKFKEATDPIPQSSSAGSTEAKGLPLQQSASITTVANQTPPMQTTKKRSKYTSTTDKSGLTESVRVSAVMMKASLSVLARSGFVRRYKVLSNDKTVVKAIQVEFDMSLWSESLDLKELQQSKGVVNDV
jgi:hypothetical protein